MAERSNEWKGLPAIQQWHRVPRLIREVNLKRKGEMEWTPPTSLITPAPTSLDQVGPLRADGIECQGW